MAVRISRSLQINAIIRSAIIRSARPERDLMSLIWYRSTETLTQTTHYKPRLLKCQLLTMSYSCIDASFPRKNKTTPMGFEPTRAEHIGLAVQRLNHSATSSSWRRSSAQCQSTTFLHQHRHQQNVPTPGVEPGPSG